MKRLLFSLFVAGLIGTLPIFPSQVSDAAAAQSSNKRFLVLDVAFDARTLALNHVNPTSPDLARGDTFVINGKVFIGGAIPEGGSPGNPGTFSPDSPGSIASFICRGTSLFSGAEVAAGASPFVATTQTFVFADGSTLVTEGLEGNVTSAKRVVTGGLGEFAGFHGEVHMALLGFNSTGMENFRFTFKLRK
jgi:hypothetical protein